MPISLHGPIHDNDITIDPAVMENSTAAIILQGSNNHILISPGVMLDQASITLGTNCSLVVGPECRLAAIEVMGSRDAHVSIGAGTEFTWSSRLYLHEPGRITIGEACLIASSTMLTVSDMHSIIRLDDNSRMNHAEDITIGDRVWLAHDVTVLKGSSIGNGCVIGYRSTVSSIIPNNSLAVGSPARVIKSDITWDRRLL